MDNRDYPGNIIKYWMVPGGKWKWILYDTDFKLSASGDLLFLKNENGDLIDSLIVPALSANISYGV